jgi:hypothetical protein
MIETVTDRIYYTPDIVNEAAGIYQGDFILSKKSNIGQTPPDDEWKDSSDDPSGR